LIDGGREHTGSVCGTDTPDVFLRDADQRRKRKWPDHFGPMGIMAVHASSMAVVVEQ
jgi:hypothetical protein